MAVGVGLDAADIWIHDLERDTRTRLTFDPADDRSPVWSPDDDRLAFWSGRAAEGELWVRPTSGQGAAERLFTAETSILLTDWSSDGRLIFFDYLELDDDSLDVWTFNLQTSEARPLLSGKPEQQGASLSPDGKWLAFTSDESGKSEIYVRTFPEATGRWMVSSDGSTRGAYNAVWRSDGTELYYQRWRSLLAVPVTPGGDFPFGTPQALFGINNKSGQGSSYAVNDSGDRILINERPAADPTKSDGRLLYELRHRWRDGTTHVGFEPLEFLEKLAALVPPPRFNLVRYHGVLAPAARHRARVVPSSSSPELGAGWVHAECEAVGSGSGQRGPDESPPGPRPRNYSWAELMRRVFEVDVLECPACQGPMRILAEIHPPDATRAILDCLGLSTRPPPVSPAAPESRTGFVEAF